MHLPSNLAPHLFAEPVCLDVTLHRGITPAQKKALHISMGLALSYDHMKCKVDDKGKAVSINRETGAIAPYDRIQVAQWLVQQAEVAGVVIAHGKVSAPRTLEVAFLT